MKIVFEGLELPIEIECGVVNVLEVENSTLFARICRSLSLGEVDKFEPYSIWDDEGEELSPSAALLMVSDPLNFPWDDRRLGGNLPRVLEMLMREDEERRVEIESAEAKLSALISSLTYQVNGDYAFAVEWNLAKYLKSFSFGIERYEGDSYLESCISFLDFASDMAIKQVLVFVNLKTFLSENDLQELYDRIFFLNLPVLLLENVHDVSSYLYERKVWVDQHFLESQTICQTGCTSSSQ